jgi:hypothetical protein
VAGHREASLESRIDAFLVLLSDAVLERIVDARRVKIMAAKLIRGGRGVHIVSGSITRDESEAQVITSLEGNAFTSVAARSVSTYPMGSLWEGARRVSNLRQLLGTFSRKHCDLVLG